MSVLKLTFRIGHTTLLAAALAARLGANDDGALRITHGVASGDVTTHTAVVWSRASRAATMVVEYDADVHFGRPARARARSASEADYTAQVRLTGLQPGTRYHYRVVFSDATGVTTAPVAGSFQTAPVEAAPLRFVFGGDLGGQRYCRRPGVGYAIFGHMQALAPHFFIANGDMIYADGTCPAERSPDWKNVPGDFPGIGDPTVDWTRVEELYEVFWKHWRYNRADPHHEAFLRDVPIYAQWDDHEVINDFGAAWPAWPSALERPGFANVVRAGRAALFHYNPIEHPAEEPERIYRAFQWGPDVDLLLLDARSYRSPNDAVDLPDGHKTLLGREQLAWLKARLAASRAVWKIVSSDVPLSVPTGWSAERFGRDGWANGQAADYSSRTGFERELLDLLKHLDARNVDNVVFVVTDVHFPMNLRYELDLDGDGDTLLFHELVSGPLSAYRMQVPFQLDPTLRPTILYGEGDVFNFGFVEIQRDAGGVSHLSADVRDDAGVVRPGSRLRLTPR